MSATLNGSFALQCFECGNTVKLHNGRILPGTATHALCSVNDVCLQVVFDPDSKVCIHIPQEKLVQSQVHYDGYKGGSLIHTFRLST